MKWVEGHVYFGKGWTEFVKACSISVGDIVVLSKKMATKTFRVVIYQTGNYGVSGERGGIIV